MFCEKCGKEVKSGEAFCKSCGAPVKQAAKKTPAQASVFAEYDPARFGGNGTEGKKAERKSIKDFAMGFLKDSGKMPLLIAAGGAAVLIIAVIVGCLLYFNSNGYQSGSNLKLARECRENGDYKEALSYCEEALAKDEDSSDAYLEMAEIYLEMAEDYSDMEAYGDAADILNQGLRKTKEDKDAQALLNEGLENVYKAQAHSLIGVWELRNYDILPLFLGDDMAELLGDMKLEVTLLWEFSDDMSFRLYVDGKSLSEVTGGAASQLISYLGGGIFSGIGGKAVEYLTNLLAGNALSDMAYKIEGGTLYMRDESTGDGWEGFAYTIDGDRLLYDDVELLRSK